MHSQGQWFGWDSKAEVATHIAADNHWTVEIRLPVTQDENDPLHQVVGRKPTQSLPWHINICRQRIRDDDAALTAYQAIIDGRPQIDSADEFAALQGIARILTRKGRFDEALAILNRANPDQLHGTRRDRILKSIDDVHHPGGGASEHRLHHHHGRSGVRRSRLPRQSRDQNSAH